MTRKELRNVLVWLFEVSAIAFGLWAVITILAA